jgi:hypothetical protein
MANEHEPDLGQLWRQQSQPPQPMPLDEVRVRAAAFDRRVQRWRTIGGVLFALLIAKNAWEVWIAPDALERAGDLLLLAALLYVGYWFRAHARAETSPAALGRATCVEHYRSRLVRQRDLSRDSWKWVLPFVPGLAVSLLGGLMEPRPAGQIAALIVIATATLAIVLWMNGRTARQIERELAALD